MLNGELQMLEKQGKNMLRMSGRAVEPLKYLRTKKLEKN